MRLFHGPLVGELVPGVRVFGQTVDVYAARVGDELARRRHHGAGPILNLELLQALMRIPSGTAVRLGSLDPCLQAVLVEAGVPAGAVRVSGADVVREAIAPVSLVGLVKHARCWHDVTAIGWLRTHAPRLVVTDSPRLAHRILCDTPLELGVGYGSFAEGMEVLRRPGRRWLCPSWQRWLLAETTYAALLDSRRRRRAS